MSRAGKEIAIVAGCSVVVILVVILSIVGTMQDVEADKQWAAEQYPELEWQRVEIMIIDSTALWEGWAEASGDGSTFVFHDSVAYAVDTVISEAWIRRVE